MVRAPNGRSLRFVSTHFQHNVADDRLAEAQAVNKLFAADEKLPTILAGDMNAVPDSEPIRELLKHWAHASDTNTLPTAPSPKPTSRIDYIFYRRSNSFRLIDAKVIEESKASDHRPVLAVLELTTE